MTEYTQEACGIDLTPTSTTVSTTVTTASRSAPSTTR